MKYAAPITIIVLFAMASLITAYYKDTKLSLIYLLSALLNIVFLMKG